MAYFDDFQAAVLAYPSHSVTLTIEDLWGERLGTSGAVNVDEVWSFRVKITNNGCLILKNVRLVIEGQNGATVSRTAGGTFAEDIWVEIAHVGAKMIMKTEKLFFKAPSVAQPAGTPLVSLYIRFFHADLDAALGGSGSKEGGPVATHAAQVFPRQFRPGEIA